MRSSENIVVDALIAQAQAHARKRAFEDAALLLRSALKTFPRRAVLWGLLGSMEFQQKHYQPAVAAFRRAVELTPTSELASLGLFHSLFHLGRRRAAIAELKRFQTVSHCDDYEEIAAEMGIRLPVAA